MPCVWPLLVSLLKIVCCVWALTAAEALLSAIDDMVSPFDSEKLSATILTTPVSAFAEKVVFVPFFMVIVPVWM